MSKHRCNCLDFFINFSQSMIQGLKLDTIADFGLPNMLNSSDHEVGAHFNKIKKA